MSFRQPHAKFMSLTALGEGCTGAFLMTFHQGCSYISIVSVLRNGVTETCQVAVKAICFHAPVSPTVRSRGTKC